MYHFSYYYYKNILKGKQLPPQSTHTLSQFSYEFCVYGVNFAIVYIDSIGINAFNFLLIVFYSRYFNFYSIIFMLM